MIKICMLKSGNCPLCNEQVNIGKTICTRCGAGIRFINQNKIKNSNYSRKIIQYDLNGELMGVHDTVYHAYPLDSKEGHRQRAHVISVCNGSSKRFDNCQWRYSNDERPVGKISEAKSSKSVLQVDFSGKVIGEFQSITYAINKLNLTATTIRKACKKRFPPQGTEFFLFFATDFCQHVFEEALQKYQERQITVEVRDEN